MPPGYKGELPKEGYFVVLLHTEQLQRLAIGVVTSQGRTPNGVAPLGSFTEAIARLSPLAPMPTVKMSWNALPRGFAPAPWDTAAEAPLRRASKELAAAIAGPTRSPSSRIFFGRE